VVNEDETNYDVLGVAPSATKEEIRSAYRERLADAQAAVTREETAKKPSGSAIAEAREDEASIRAAWQVLSDPMQRERYDAARGIDNTGTPLDFADDDEDDEDEVEMTPRERRAADRARVMADRPPGLFSTEIPPTPKSWPPGVQPPPPRARFFALTIDVFVLSILIALQLLVTPLVIDQFKPGIQDKLDTVSTQIDKDNNAKDKADSAADKASSQAAKAKKNGNTEAEATATQAEADAKKQSKTLDKKITKEEDKQTELRNELLPITIGVSLVVFLLALLYLVPSSVRTGRTFGKKMLQIRAVYADGSPLTLRGAIRRYGAPLVAGLFLSSIVGPLGYMFVLVGVLTWPRNPNYQGLQDRIAKTIVVDG
jgi:curved DNA-binding protein CbpA